MQSHHWTAQGNVVDIKQKNYQHNSPVFLIGFPRSGTTLAEQLLFTRSDLIVTDELSIIDNLSHSPNITLDLPQRQYPADHMSFNNEDLSTLRQAYFSSMEKNLGTTFEDQIILDKNPIAIIYLSTISQLFPESKILMMIRDPRDVCISCFFQSFSPNYSNFHFYSLEDTIDYYVRVMNLYLHYKEVLSLNILEIKYEDLCHNLTDNSKKMMKFIGQKWDKKVLEFYKQERYISTPSFNTVSQPINAKAIGNWKNYQEQLAPYLPQLEPFIKAFGYE